jgi:hypothetical protein
VATGSLALYYSDAGPWSGGLDFRYLGRYALSSGRCVNAATIHDFPGVAGCVGAPTLPGQVDGRGFGELNLDVHYAWHCGWVAALGLYNLLDTHAPAAQFWYVDRLRSEIDSLSKRARRYSPASARTADGAAEHFAPVRIVTRTQLR